MYASPYLGDAFVELLPHWAIEHAATGGLAKAELSVRLHHLLKLPYSLKAAASL